MKVNYIALAIPFFFLLIGLELLVARFQRRLYYRFNDAISDLSCGILQQVMGLLVAGALTAGYFYLHEHHRLLTLSSDSSLVWVFCFLGVDLGYYWFHRHAHEINFLWATHVVHHQSEEYNLAVALRQSVFQSWFSWAWYLPLAVIGFPPIVYLTCLSFNTLYQFWIHTRTVRTLGPLEWVLNTPSHHRVHHGRNPKYIDRNYAGVFIIWDRLFGTFQAEEEEPVYGVTEPLRSWNPVWANLHTWAGLFHLAGTLPRWSDRVRLFFKPPGWMPDLPGGRVVHKEVDREAYQKFDTHIPAGLSLYLFMQYVVLVAGTTALIFVAGQLAWPMRLGAVMLVMLALVTIGGLFERRSWAFYLEAARLGLLLVAALVGSWGTGLELETLAATLVGSAVSLAWLLRFRELFSPDLNRGSSGVRSSVEPSC